MLAIRTVIAALLGCALAGAAAAARPLIIEESSTIQSPDPAIYSSFGFEVATNGEEALIAGFDDKANASRPATPRSPAPAATACSCTRPPRT